MNEIARAEPPKAKTVAPAQGGVALLLTLAMLTGVGSCLFVFFHARDGAEIATQFGMELPQLAKIYVQLSGIAFAFPTVVWAGAMAMTRLGRTQQNVGQMLMVLLFGFALLWGVGAFVAFQLAYDPPRTEHTRER